MEPDQQTHVTISDVASAAGVSRATASRALGDYGRVGIATQQKVREVADQLGYRVNNLARAVRAGRSSTIGLIITDIANPFFARATRAVAETAQPLGYEIVTANTNEDREAGRRAVRVLLEKRVDGLIVVPAAGETNDGLFGAPRPPIPTVLLDRRLSGFPGTSVISDDASATEKATELLVSCGHQRIALLDGNATIDGFARRRPRAVVSTAADRVAGFMAAVKAHRAEVKERWVVYASMRESAASLEAAMWLLSQDPRPTAIVANNSDLALAVVLACRELGLRVGADVSLITFDDADWTRALEPPVSVVARPVEQMGETAVRELVREIAGEPPTGLIVLPNRLVDRASVRAVGRSRTGAGLAGR